MHSNSITPEEYHLCIHGQLFAKLYEPQMEEMFWCSYCVEPIHPAARDVLKHREMWINNWFDIKMPDGEGYHPYTFAGGSFLEYCKGETDRFSFRSLFPGACDPPTPGSRFMGWLRCFADFLAAQDYSRPRPLTSKQNRIRWTGMMKLPEDDTHAADSESEFIEPDMGPEANVKKMLDEALPGIEWGSEDGTYNHEGCTLEFSLSELNGHVYDVWIHVEGPRKADVFPLLFDVAGANGWIVKDAHTSEILDQQNPSRKGWNKVHDFRDRVESAIKTMRGS